MKRLFLLSLLSVFFLHSCKKPDGTVVDDKPPVNENITVVTNLNNDMVLKLVNDIRTKGCNCGTTVMPPVQALKWNNLLALASAYHAKDMDDNKFLSHTSPTTGKGTTDRVTATGYDWKTVGENIASGFYEEEKVFNAWLNSEDHCKNIMAANFKNMGAARSGIYWVMVFGTKSGE